jgi:hypothetical protein
VGDYVKEQVLCTQTCNDPGAEVDELVQEVLDSGEMWPAADGRGYTWPVLGRQPGGWLAAILVPAGSTVALETPLAVLAFREQDLESVRAQFEAPRWHHGCGHRGPFSEVTPKS